MGTHQQREDLRAWLDSQGVTNTTVTFLDAFLALLHGLYNTPPPSTPDPPPPP